MTTIVEYDIGMRDLLRSPKKIKDATKNGQSFTVYDHRKPVFRVVPIVEIQKKCKMTDLKNLKGFVRTAQNKQTISQTDDELLYAL